MAFNDLFTSARGPGVIGMIMALIVLLGFGLLFMFAFEEGSQGGGRSLASVIRENTSVIANLKSDIASGASKMDQAPRLKEISSKLSSSVSLNKSLSLQISEKKNEIAGLKENLAVLEREWEDYRNTYRSFVREKAGGTSMPELKTSDGTVYVDVDIRSVSAIGMDIRHRDGFKRIGFEELPADLQDYYQFDKDQMHAEAEREAKVRLKHDKAVAAAGRVADERKAEEMAKKAQENREKTLLAIAAKESQAKAIEDEISQIERDIVAAEAAASAARAAGKMHLNKSGSLRGTLNSKRNALSQLRAEILRLQSSI
ncbi:hypothetical protein HZ994_03065 [Akkermansiaceae bacterium]|nr:hypothetical protein HZ994_03065 [Akkermansiaceae bacterium]